jgi:hypothetical protein
MGTIERSRALSRTHEDLVDLAIARYVDWREECAAVAGLYGEWCSAGCGARRTAFLAYRSALEDEDRLGELYACAIAQLEWALSPEPPPPSMSPYEA